MGIDGLILFSNRAPNQRVSNICGINMPHTCMPNRTVENWNRKELSSENLSTFHFEQRVGRRRRLRFVCQRSPSQRFFKWPRHSGPSRLWWFNVYFCHESDNNFCLTYIFCGSNKMRERRVQTAKPGAGLASPSTRQSTISHNMRIERSKRVENERRAHRIENAIWIMRMRI